MKNSLLILFGLALIGTDAVCAAPAKPTPVEVWIGGDDSLTTGLRNVLENAFQSSSDFVVSSGRKQGTLIVTIPTHVGWKRVGKRTKVFYTVEFSSVDNQALGASKGSCWDDAMMKCATQIYREAQRVKEWWLNFTSERNQMR